MSGVIRKREDQHRDRLLRDFVRVITRLRGANELIRSSVGRSIDIANQLFIQRFGSVEHFQASSGEKKDQYIGSLARAEECFTNRWPTTAIGFSLFKMWLEALTEKDEALAKHLSIGLSALSAKGSGGMYYHSFTAANSPKFSAGEAISS
jgi:hypothetical protein